MLDLDEKDLYPKRRSNTEVLKEAAEVADFALSAC